LRWSKFSKKPSKVIHRKSAVFSPICRKAADGFGAERRGTKNDVHKNTKNNFVKFITRKNESDSHNTQGLNPPKWN